MPLGREKKKQKKAFSYTWGRRAGSFFYMIVLFFFPCPTYSIHLFDRERYRYRIHRQSTYWKRWEGLSYEGVVVFCFFVFVFRFHFSPLHAFLKFFFFSFFHLHSISVIHLPTYRTYLTSTSALPHPSPSYSHSLEWGKKALKRFQGLDGRTDG